MHLNLLSLWPLITIALAIALIGGILYKLYSRKK